MANRAGEAESGAFGSILTVASCCSFAAPLSPPMPELAHRELDDALGLTTLAGDVLADETVAGI